MTTAAEALMPATAQTPSPTQRLFVRYFTGCLIDLVVLGLFDEYSANVNVASFTWALLAAVLLQFLLKATIAVEHWVLGFFTGRTGGAWTALKFFVAWLIVFGSKFVILEALSLAFGDKVQFVGVFHGLLWLILVVVVMLVAEELVVRIYRRLAAAPAAATPSPA